MDAAGFWNLYRDLKNAESVSYTTCLKRTEFFLNGKEGWKQAFDQDGQERVGGPGHAAHGSPREARAEVVLALILGSAGLKLRLTGGQVSERQGVGFLAFLCLKISLALKNLLLTRPLLLVSDSSAVRWGCGCLLSVYKLDSLFLSETVSNRLVQK